MMEIESRVQKHENKLARIEAVLESIADNQKTTSNTMKELSKTMAKTEVLLEKITNLKDTTDSSIDRLHKRIDTVDNTLVTKSDNNELIELKEKVKRLEPLVLVLKFPKLVSSIFIFGYLFAIQEVREIIFPFLG